MGLFGQKKDYAAIGRNSTAEDFKQALNDGNGASSKIIELSEGAIEAFAEGRKENVQILCHAMPSFDDGTSSSILSALIDNAHEEPDEAIKLAFAATSEANRKDVLTRVITKLIDRYSAKKYEKLIEAALKNGANANVAIDGYPGTLLAKAAYRNLSPHILDRLYACGADANGALKRAKSYGYNQQDKNTIADYARKQNEIEKALKDGAIAIPENEILIMFRQMQENIADLTKRVDTLQDTTGQLAEQVQTQTNNIAGLIKVIGYLVDNDNTETTGKEQAQEKTRATLPGRIAP